MRGNASKRTPSLLGAKTPSGSSEMWLGATYRFSYRPSGAQPRGHATQEDYDAMQPAALPQWMALLTAVAMASVGCAHTQQPERRVYVISEDAKGVGVALATGGSGGHDCQEEHEECVKRCWNKKDWPYPHNKKQSGWYLERCEHDCRVEFNKCEEEQEEAARERAKKFEFSRIDEAIDWLKAHKAEVALGTVIIVAGVAFVLSTGGAGALILIPLAL